MSRFVALALALVGCAGPGSQPSSCEPVDDDLLVVASTDFTVGALSTLGLDDGAIVDPAAPAGGDPKVRALSDGRVALLERGAGDSLRLYTPGCWDVPDVEVALDQDNPHDALLHDGLLWLARYDGPGLWVLDPADGERLFEVDLSAEDDADGLPEPSSLVLRDGRLFVGLERIDRDAGWQASRGRIVELDPSGAVVARFDVGPNPRVVVASELGLVVVEAGAWGEPDGALRAVDPATGEGRVLLDEADLGLDLWTYAETDGVGIVTGVAFDGQQSAVICVDLATGVTTPGPTSEGWYADVIAWGGRAWLALRAGWYASTTTGVVELDPRTCAASAPVPLTLNPYGLAVRPQAP